MAKRRNKAARRQGPKHEVKQGGNRQVYLICGMLILATLVVYLQARDFQFINCDDDLYVENNQAVRSDFGTDSIRYAFTSTAGGNWMPGVWISYMLDHARAGGKASAEDPRPYHVTNLVLHIANALLLFLVLNAMTGFKWRSGFVALLFAIHPLHAESVAWIAERKDTLSTLFWLLTMLAYVGFVREPSRRRYGLMLGAFVLGLMSKPMLVSLPIVLLLVDIWPLRRLAEGGKSLGGLVIEKLPLLAISGAACVVAVIIQKRAAALTSLSDFPLGIRLANAAVSSVAYIRKMFWPSDLGWQYPHPGSSLPVWQVAGSALVLAVLTGAAVWAIKRRPYVTVGWFWYVITLVPVVGLVQVGHQGMADRYTYVPLIGLFIVITWGAVELAQRFNADRAVPIAAAAAGLGLMVCAYHQVGFWRDSVALCERSIRINPKNAVAHCNLGLALLTMYPKDPEMRDRAIEHLETTLELDGSDIGAEYGLGTALLQKGEQDRAFEHFSRAVRLDLEQGKSDPQRQGGAENAIGVLLWQKGKWLEGFKHVEIAARACPDNADILKNRDYMRQHLATDSNTGR